MKNIKSQTYKIVLERFTEYAFEHFGRLDTRISLEHFAKWLDWRATNPDREFYRFERFL